MGEPMPGPSPVVVSDDPGIRVRGNDQAVACARAPHRHDDDAAVACVPRVGQPIVGRTRAGSTPVARRLQPVEGRPSSVRAGERDGSG